MLDKAFDKFISLDLDYNHDGRPVIRNMHCVGFAIKKQANILDLDPRYCLYRLRDKIYSDGIDAGIKKLSKF